MLVVLPTESAALLGKLPASASWLATHRRESPRPAQVRSFGLPGGQGMGVLGYARRTMSQFERLALAGQMMREVAARRPARLAMTIDGALGAAEEWFEALIAAALAHSFTMPQFRRQRAPAWRLRTLDLYAAPTALPVARIVASAQATNLVRWLTALPPNVLDARAYRRLLQSLAREHGLKMQWYDEAALRRLGAGAFLAVTRGNPIRTAGIARLTWNGRSGRDIDVALVGKGVLFDTGGINLKPHRYMLDMHTDMAGSAVALATLLALARLRRRVNAEAWLAITENNIGPDAYRPQDVVQALNGVTIQVIHTDAEGRMALADTLALAARGKPRLMVDFATLTGACVSALTERYSGVFSSDARLTSDFLAAGVRSGERLWSFPLDADFDSDLDSSIADIKQCATEGKGDHILATRFLQRFVPEGVRWAHVDLSSATRTGGLAHVPTEITGFGAGVTLRLLLDRGAQ